MGPFIEIWPLVKKSRKGGGWLYFVDGQGKFGVGSCLFGGLTDALSTVVL